MYVLFITLRDGYYQSQVSALFWDSPEDGGSKLLENVGELFTDRHDVINQKTRIFSTVLITSNFAMTTSLKERISEFLVTLNGMCGVQQLFVSVILEALDSNFYFSSG
jgi:hypothetical protein